MVSADSPLKKHPVRFPAWTAHLCAVATLGCCSAVAHAQATEAFAALPPAPSFVKASLATSQVSGLRADAAKPGALPLSLDEAIALGLEHNVNVELARQQEHYVKGEILSVENVLLPNLTAVVQSQAAEINLAAMGFKPSLIDSFKFPGFSPAGFSTIVKVNTTSAQLNLSQEVFDASAFYLFRAARRSSEGAAFNTLNARGAVVVSVATSYLRVLADAAMVEDAKALVQQDRQVYDHAKLSQDAGIGIHLDTLRAQVQLQQEQQALIQAENTLAKDKIALDREMGLPAGQELRLTDTVPFAEYAGLSIEDARALAYTRRKDLLNLESQLSVAEETRRAVKFERLPTLGIGGYYGVIGVTNGSYHGNFVAQGSLTFPIFEEGALRGQREVADAQLVALRRQVDSLKVTIEQQIRSSLLDVQSSAELVKAARSNVDLAQKALADATMRYEAGVDDSLPVVRAQAALAAAQAQLVQTQYQYNAAKLMLARNTGVVETQYKAYLGR